MMNCTNPKISVIIPVYNVESYLVRCVDSLVNQTLKDIEIILVNDGSQDGSAKIIDQYKAKYDNIKAIHKENGGLSDARNVGIAMARGNFLSFVDSDDWVDLRMLEQMYDLLLRYDAEIAICGLVKVNEKREEFRALPQSPQLPEKIVLEEDFRIFGEMSCFACNKIFKRELFQDKEFKKGIHFEDIELIPQLVLSSNVIVKSNKLFYKYFERSDSITRTHSRKGLDLFLALDSVTKYFEQSKYRNQAQELKRFQILQGYFSYLAYVAFVKDKDLKSEMIDKLKSVMQEFGIQKNDILKYIRFNENYLRSLPLKKQVYYYLSILSLNLLKKI